MSGAPIEPVTPAAEIALAAAPSARRGVIREALRTRPAAIVGIVLLTGIVLMAIFAPLIAPYSPTDQSGPVFQAPSGAHLLGTDDGGIDVLSELIYGARTSLTVGFAAAVIATLIGGGIAIAAGYFGGTTDGVLMRITDYFLVIPDLVLMIVVAAIWGPSVFHVIVVIGILLWTGTARIVRSQVKSVRERVYVKRARSLGASHGRIVVQHVLPQVAPLIIATTVLAIAIAVFDESALAFLGVGVPGVSWGTMLEFAYIRSAVINHFWWTFVPPGLAIALVIVACYLIGQAIEDALNPRLRVSHLSVRSWRYLANPLKAQARTSADDDEGAS